MNESFAVNTVPQLQFLAISYNSLKCLLLAIKQIIG